MSTDSVEKSMMTTVMAVMMAAVMLTVIQQLWPVQAAPIMYVCPICGQEFATLAELEEHFTSTHPTTPIDIIWS